MNNRSVFAGRVVTTGQTVSLKLSQGMLPGSPRFISPVKVLYDGTVLFASSSPAGQNKSSPTAPVSIAPETNEPHNLPFNRRTGLSLLTLAALLLGWRWFGHSHYLIDWDAANYALGLYHYDVRHDQPQIPGYFLYIYVGRLFLPLTRDPNLALVLVSTVFGALCTGVLYVLGRDVFDRRVGALAAILGITSPLLWFQSNVASSRTAEGFFGLLVAWLCARVRWRGSPDSIWVLAVALALAGGIRQQIAPFLLPLCIWATWQEPLKRRLLALVLFLGLCLIWFIPMLISVGGIASYRALSKAQWDTFVVQQTGVFYAASMGDALRRFTENNSRLFLYAAYTLPLGLLLLPAAIWEAWRRKLLVRGQRVHFLLFATLPSLVFFSLFHIQQTGHAMSYAPFFLLSAAYGWSLLPRRLQAPGALCLIGANLAFVYGAPAYLGQDGRFTTPSNQTIRRTDQQLGAVNTVIASRLQPTSSAIIATDGVFRSLDFYAPHYRLYSPALDDGPHPAFHVVTHKAEKIPVVKGAISLPTQVHTLLIMGTSALPQVNRATRTVTVLPPRGKEPWTITYSNAMTAETLTQDGLPFVILQSTQPIQLTLTGRTLQITNRL